MPAKNQVPRLVALICALLASTSASRAAIATMPFARGTTWIYEGTVSWQEGTDIKRKHVRLVTEIVETFTYSKARVAVVRSFPTELAWFGDRPHPKYSVLVLTPEGLAEIETRGAKEASKLAQDESTLTAELKLRKNTIVSFPLSQGRRFHSLITGVPPSNGLTVYRSTYRTNPDHTIVDFVPTVGVVRFIYEHHGTVSSVNVRLVHISRTAGRD